MHARDMIRVQSIPVDRAADQFVADYGESPDLVAVAQHLLVAHPVVRVPHLSNTVNSKPFNSSLSESIQR